MAISTLAPHSSSALIEPLDLIVQQNEIWNAFNPSISAIDGGWAYAFRGASTPGVKPFRAWFFKTDSEGTLDPRNLVDLTEAAGECGIPIVADPKLVKLNGRLFVTFNSGYVAHGQNDIYLQQVYPTILSPQRCVLPTRFSVEKNWAFRIDPTGQLRVLYGVSPLVELTLVAGELGDDSDLQFSIDSRIGQLGAQSDLTIGTQLLIDETGKASMVLHQKIRVLNRRAYVGRFATIDWSSGVPELTVGRTKLVHSALSMLPPLRRHNPNLISATYFSGLTRVGNSLVFSYGVNDLKYGIAEVEEGQSWK